MLRHLPNFLSALRLVLAPVAGALVAVEHPMAAFGVFVFAGFTDAIDGTLAKLVKNPTQFGKILDPLADKALMTAGLIGLAYVGEAPVWLAVVVIGRDLLIGAAYGISVLRGTRLDTTPLVIGKLTTAVQVIYIAAHLAALAFSFSLAAVAPWDGYIVAAVTALSGGAYFWRWLEAIAAPRTV